MNKQSHEMTEQLVIQLLENMNIGCQIPGIIKGKTYTYMGLQKYPGRGRYSHLKGALVAIIKSEERRRSLIRLFIEPLTIMVNSKSEELAYGHMPLKYARKYCNGGFQEIPNLCEYESHYKCLALYIKRLAVY